MIIENSENTTGASGNIRERNTPLSRESVADYCRRNYKLLGLRSINDPDLPEVLCADSHTPRRFLALYAQSSESELLELIASNPNTPESVMAGLAFHYVASVRAMAASNKMLSISLSESLAFDESAFVRFALASNPRSSRLALELLQKDNNLWISKRATKTAKGV